MKSAGGAAAGVALLRLEIGRRKSPSLADPGLPPAGFGGFEPYLGYDFPSLQRKAGAGSTPGAGEAPTLQSSAPKPGAVFSRELPTGMTRLLFPARGWMC